MMVNRRGAAGPGADATLKSRRPEAGALTRIGRAHPIRHTRRRDPRPI